MKPGIQTTELWLVVANTILDATGTMPHHATLPAALATIAYALGRSLVKVGGTKNAEGGPDILAAISGMLGGKLDTPSAMGKLGDHAEEVPPTPAKPPPQGPVSPS